MSMVPGNAKDLILAGWSKVYGNRWELLLPEIGTAGTEYSLKTELQGTDNPENGTV